jgi:glutamine synthetase
VWNFDGSSTGQNFGDDTEVLLVPVREYPSPIDMGVTLVLCQLNKADDPFTSNDTVCYPNFNTRLWAEAIAEREADAEMWFGLEQEYTLLDPHTPELPYNWSEHGRRPQGEFYCSVGYPQCQLGEMAREHLRMCIGAGIKISGINAEVMPSQWEFQIGPADLLRAADDLIVARYLLLRLSERYKVRVSFAPKPVRGDFNGSGCHINFSTAAMRNGYEAIETAVERLQTDHPNLLKYYGDNKERLTGAHETSSPTEFSYGVGTRNTSIRIPNSVKKDRKGYIEDRRPASDIDPYLALGALMDTVLKTA